MKKFIPISSLLLVTLLFVTIDIQAQRRGGGRYYGGRGYHSRSSVSIGIGGVFGGFYSQRYYPRPRVGVSVGIGFPGGGVYINSLPYGYRRFYYGGFPYFYFNNNYYREIDGGRYQEVDAPLGATLSRLPSGARERRINGVTYYEFNGTYYMADVNTEGRRVYIVVGEDGELNTQEVLRISRENDKYDRMENNENDEVYDSNSRPQRNSEDNGNYYNRPEVGDRFDQLPTNSKSVMVNGEKQFISPNGTYYKEVIEEGRVSYEVVKTR